MTDSDELNRLAGEATNNARGAAGNDRSPAYLIAAAIFSLAAQVAGLREDVKEEQERFKR